ncbi:MAG: penicillin-binding transpeptidase domain-containing protein, partial [Candidatus Competibacterales bacterium]|nr:penicillin-binding transpeptidase domain-containing protein [Candidatus Competibacterales bacterium]
PWYAGETVIAGIGQGYMLVTPLQLAHATATVAMQGQRIRPRLLHAAQIPGTGVAVTELAQTLPAVEYVDLLGWRYVIHAMTEVVHGSRGTARRIGRGLDYRIAGKTGTAQVFSLAEDEEYDAESLARELRDHSLFVAFAPVEDPRIALAVIAEHGGSGSAVAAPIARQILDAYLEDGAHAPQPAQ